MSKSKLLILSECVDKIEMIGKCEQTSGTAAEKMKRRIGITSQSPYVLNE